MINLKNKLKEHNCIFWLFQLYLILLILIPKGISEIGGFLPIRLCLTIILIFITLLRIKCRKVATNRIKCHFVFLVYFLFLISLIPSICVSKNVILSIYTLFKFTSYIFLLYIFLKVKFTKEEYILFLKTLIVCSGIKILLGIIEYIFNINLTTIGIYRYPGSKGRVSAGFFNTIYLGMFINLVFVILFYLYNKTTKIKYKIGFFILCVASVVCLLLTFTRSALLVFLGIFFIVLILLNKKIINKFTILLIITCFGVSIIIPGVNNFVLTTLNDGITMFTDVNVLSKFLPAIDTGGKNKTNFEDLSLEHRKEFSVVANKIASDHQFTGVGIGAYYNYLLSNEFKSNYPQYSHVKTHPHSSLVLLYAEAGIISFFLFICFIIGIGVLLIKLLIENFKKKSVNFDIVVLLFAISCGFAIVNIIAENAIYDTQIFPFYLMILGIIISFVNMDKKEKNVLFIASTGGHLNELLQLSPLFKKYNSTLITEKTKTTNDLKKKYANVHYLVYGSKDHLFTYFFKFSYNVIKSIIYYFILEPDVIVTTGTHTAVPICYIGKLFGSKIIFIETFANSSSKTLSGKLVYPIVDTFIVQWKEMLELYPKAIYGGWVY